MICRKTTEACHTPGMCAPHGGCSPESRPSVPARPEFKGAICKGSYALGSACGKCERCAWERAEHPDRMEAYLAARQQDAQSKLRHSLKRVLTSLECTAAWLEGGCNPLHAAEELRLNIANIEKLRGEL
jgi:hypothetical protein